LPPQLANLTPFAEEVKKLVDSVRDPNAIKKFTETKRPKPLTPNKNFAKDEFKELWKRINHKAAYTVDFSSDELIKKAIEALDRQIDIPKLTYTVKKATQTGGGTFVAGVHESHKVDEHYTDTGLKYDLIGKVAEGTVLTRKTVRDILAGMQKARFDQFKNNPEKFIAEVIRIINEQKATMIVEHIQYHILEDTYSSDIFTKNQMILPAHMTPIRDDGKPLQKHIYDFLTADSTVERNLAKELDNSAEVVVYAKLPGGFTIPTPVGSYNPDWAIAFKEGSVKHVYFVAETKGTLSDMHLKKIEKTKIDCAEKFFLSLGAKDTQYHVTYRQVATYTDLMNMANSDSGD
jgi:type III restriction enzyme